MIKVVEFKSRKFWSSAVDVTKLNEKIKEYETSGWNVQQISPLTTFTGKVSAYVLVLDKDWGYHHQPVQ